MSTAIKLRRSATPGKVPTTAQLDLGEVAINTYDGKIFIKKDDGAEAVVEIGGVGFTGSQGFTGSAGPTGFVGSQGTTGFAGSQGFTGSQGIQGDTGFTGSVGFTGSAGPIGFTGSQGETGFTGSAGNTGFTGSQGDIGFTGSRGSFEWIVKTSNYTAQNLEAIIADTSGGSFTIDLPLSPTLGDYVTLADGADWSVNNLTVSRNGSTIEGLTSDFVLNVNDIRVEFVYDGTTWQVYTNIGRRGETGFTGSLGFTGSQGPLGFTGSQGPVGFTGSRGNTGFTGSAGPSTTINAVNDNSTTTHFPVFVAGTGDQPAKLSNSGNLLSFVPSTGTLNSVDFNSTSDASLKENVSIIDDSLTKVLSINGVRYNYKSGDKRKRIGVLAQEVEQVLPEVVSENNEGYKTVSYGSMVALLIEAIKDLNERIQSLEKGQSQ